MKIRELWFGRDLGVTVIRSWLIIVLLVACQPSTSDSQPSTEQVTPPKLRWTEAEESGGALPIRLTGSDGHGLTLVAMQANAIVQAPLAFTELRLRFQNPENRRREGRFEITLPPTAAVSRFAMRIGDRFQEGEVVEKQAARRAYEDFLHRRQDPALLEQDTANHFRARVFPIEPRQEKEIIISYSEQLPHQRQPFRLYLAGLPAIEALSVRVLAGASELRLEEERFAPSGDLILEGGRAPLPNLAVRHGELIMARITPALESSAVDVKGLTILFDTSASVALGYKARIQRLGRLVRRLSQNAKDDFPVNVFAFDQSCEALFSGPVSQLQRGLSVLQKRMPLGASDLQKAFQKLTTETVHPRLLLVTDAVVTAGEPSFASLVKQVEALGTRGAQRLDVMLVGGIHDRTRAAQLAASGLSRPGTVVLEQTDDQQLLYALTHSPQNELLVEVGQASWYWPRRLPSILPGEQVLVVAKIPESLQEPQIRIGKAQSLRLEPVTVAKPLLRRAWAQARISELESSLDNLDASASAQRASLEAEVVALSTRYRVLSSQTALLVLETEVDYKRFGIDRQALSEILVVGEDGLEVLDAKRRAKSLAVLQRDRQEEGEDRLAGQQLPSPSRSRQTASEDGRRFESQPLELAEDDKSVASDIRRNPLATVLKAMGDRGQVTPTSVEALAQSSGENARRLRASSSRRAARTISRVKMRASGRPITERRIQGQVRTTLVKRSEPPFDDTVVDRVIKMRSSAVRACYERELRQKPRLRGSVLVEFTIQPRGNVTSVTAKRNTTGDDAVVACVTSTIKRFRFNPGPKQEVTYQHRFTFVPRSSQAVMSERRRQEQAAALARRRAMKQEWDARPRPDLSAVLEGRLLSVMAAVEAGDQQDALLQAWRWRAEAPGDVLALIGLGQALEAVHDQAQAARAYGSIIDLFPSRADLRRMAGNYLERVTDPDALLLAVDSYKRAQTDRPDHPNSHRLYAWALVKAQQYEKAFRALRKGYARGYPSGRFAGVKQILADDLRILATVWKKAQPTRTKLVDEQLRQLGIKEDITPSLRFILSWETDANDVDFHIYDGRHGHAFYERKELPSGGRLFSDVTTGYGPECFRIDRPKAYPFELSAHYFSRGPMGYGMGKLQIVHHDGKGGLRFDERPFVIMKDGAFVHLGLVEAS